MAATKSFAASILRECGFQSEDALYEYLESIPEGSFTLVGLPLKKAFCANLRNRLRFIEIEGETVREAKAMTSPGNLMDSMRSDYLWMRNSYMQKRKRLKEQLQKIQNLKK